jgi:hypothetical protein
MKSVKKSFMILLILQGLMFVGCEESSTKVEANGETEVLGTTENSTKDFFVAKDNTLHDVNSTFGIFDVVVYADKVLDNTPSNATKAIYGKINGQPTNALLSINSNYKDGTAFIVKVFENSKLVGESKKSILSAGTLEFSDITTK